jgi:hypothetical protein
MGCVELWWGYHPVVVRPLFHLELSFAGATILWAGRTDLNIPANNALLYTLSVFMTFFVHNFLNRNYRDTVDVAVGVGAETGPMLVELSLNLASSAPFVNAMMKEPQLFE